MRNEICEASKLDHDMIRFCQSVVNHSGSHCDLYGSFDEIDLNWATGSISREAVVKSHKLIDITTSINVVKLNKRGVTIKFVGSFDSVTEALEAIKAI
jgi:hypothetical protein